MADTVNYYAAKKQYYISFYSVIANRTVSFPAMLTQLDDKFTSNWNPEQVFGRQDPVMTFQNTQRELNVSFEVAAYNKNEASTNVILLNRLINFLYPAYDVAGSSNSISASPLFKVKFANMIYNKDGDINSTAEESGLVCAITNFEHKFHFDDTAGWSDGFQRAIPNRFTITFGATVLHTHDLGYFQAEEGSQRGYPSALEYPYFVRDEPNVEDTASTIGQSETTRVPTNFLAAAAARVGGLGAGITALGALNTPSSVQEGFIKPERDNNYYSDSPIFRPEGVIVELPPINTDKIIE